MILLASNNRHKQNELKNILKADIHIPADIQLVFNPIEDGKSFLENALIKARELYRLSQRPILADDSGLCVPALDGEPGIYSSRYGYDEGLASDDMGRNNLLLERMKGNQDRRAFFVCCMVLYLDENRFFIAQEHFAGQIATEVAGAGGFGYDPLFYLPEFGKTVAELPDSIKNQLSHRAKATMAIKKIMDEIAPI